MTPLKITQTFKRLPDDLYAEVAPTPVAAPQLVMFNHGLAQQLGLPKVASAAQQAVWADWLSGNQLPAGCQPISQAYMGHQFGQPVMLGDGRAVLLGDIVTPQGMHFDMQLKGAGRTPFSRGGDGRGTLSSMLREYLISEALAALGIATTRSLAVVATGEDVLRQRPQAGGILTRIAASHIRVGSFQYAACLEDKRPIKALLDYAIARHYPQLKQAKNPALALLEAVMTAQIKLVIDWLRVGFIHGVLNTDNVAIGGFTIDFGPCAFMDEYNPQQVFSSIDTYGRYAFNNQAAMTRWNLARFAESLLPLIDDDLDTAVAAAQQVLGGFRPQFDDAWQRMMAAKLGLASYQPNDEALIKDGLAVMKQLRLDYTQTFYELHLKELPSRKPYQQPAFKQWHKRWQQRTQQGYDHAAAQAANPTIIPRNHLVEAALEQAEQGQMQAFAQLHQQLQKPYAPRALDDEYYQPPREDERVLQTFCGT